MTSAKSSVTRYKRANQGANQSGVAGEARHPARPLLPVRAARHGITVLCKDGVAGWRCDEFRDSPTMGGGGSNEIFRHGDLELSHTTSVGLGGGPGVVLQRFKTSSTDSEVPCGPATAFYQVIIGN